MKTTSAGNVQKRDKISRNKNKWKEKTRNTNNSKLTKKNKK